MTNMNELQQALADKRASSILKRGGINTQMPISAIELADGSRLSVQASSSHYCHPREDSLKQYDSFEVWCWESFPFLGDTLKKLVDARHEDDDGPLGWVSAEDVLAIVNEHGGLSK